MADPSNGITFRTIQEAMPEYHISISLLDGLLTAIPPPPPPPGASAAWCRERLALIMDEVAARVPMDAAQGHLAAQDVWTDKAATSGPATAGDAAAERAAIGRPGSRGVA
jgi:hypothetical protein